MYTRKNILLINGSAGKNSANEKLIDYIAGQSTPFFNTAAIKDLKAFPPFDTELAVSDPPAAITDLRNQIEKADGIIICTPEYIFSIPSGLKNILEWCVATTVFSGKPTGLITASASGKKGHEELQLLMKTLMAAFTPETSLLIHGIKGKVNEQGQITDPETKKNLSAFIEAFRKLVDNG